MNQKNLPMTGLKGILRANVINQDTRNVVAKALGWEEWGDDNLPQWPGRDFKADSDEAAAILASPNGRAPVWLLATHKDQLGHKTISKVRVFGVGSLGLQILFVFEDVNVDSGDARASVSQRKRDQLVTRPGQFQGQMFQRSPQAPRAPNIDIA
jgi:hypothetical protein